MSDIEVDRDNVSGRKTDWKGNGLRNVRSGGAVKEPKLNRRIGLVGRLWSSMYLESTKQWLEPEVNQARKRRIEMIGESSDSVPEPTSEESDIVSEWLERAAALRVTTSNVRLQSTQP